MFIRITGIWMFYMFGLTCFTISVFGNLDERFRYLGISYIHIFYNSALINPSNSNDVEANSRSFFLSFQVWLIACVIGIFFYYFQGIFLISSFQAITSFEYSFCLMARSFPAVNKDGEYVIDPKLKKKETFW